jgi:hypothetical protein
MASAIVTPCETSTSGLYLFLGISVLLDAKRHTDIIELARQYGRYGYRKIAALLRQAGWSVSDGRMERVWLTTKAASMSSTDQGREAW